ncbi:hypothetical protein GCM10010299_72170 [Streptomyces tanashiensis]|nr:hypothetical protein GCM10010299_72170 [Streptomyces tanashiensis]
MRAAGRRCAGAQGEEAARRSAVVARAEIHAHAPRPGVLWSAPTVTSPKSPEISSGTLPEPLQSDRKACFAPVPTCTGVHPESYARGVYCVGGTREDVPWYDDADGREERSWKV